VDSWEPANSMLSLLRKLTDSDGISGYETKVRRVMADELRKLCKTIVVDNLGNLIGTKQSDSSANTVMLLSHMDEVGLVVKYVRPDGFINFDLCGKIDPTILPSQWIRITTPTKTIRGVIGARAGQLAESELKRPSHFSMWIDIGAKSREEVSKFGVNIGDFATYDRPLELLNGGKHIIGKALDNRAGCLVMIESLKEIIGKNVDCRVHAVGTVMEEIGSVGAKVIGNNMQSDVAIVIDGMPASDPFTPIEQCSVIVGNGPVIGKAELLIPDANVTPQWLADLAIKTAKEEGIPYQVDVSSLFYSDASAICISGHGIPTIPISIPRRNSHTPAETASIADIENTIRLIAGLVERISSTDLTVNKKI